MTISFPDLLLEKYLEWQREAGERKTLKQFAEYIGIAEVYLNNLINRRRNPGSQTIQHLADFFRDPRFYDSAGIPRPDPLLRYVIRNWGNLPDVTKAQIKEIVSGYSTEEPPDAGQQD